MKTVTITCKIDAAEFVSTFTPDHDIPEYMIADEAWRLGMLFADTQVRAIFGPYFTPTQFASIMEKLDYNYEIKET